MASKKKTERFHLESLFQRLAKLEHKLPDSVEETERPDFVLRFANEQIGLEVTSSVYQEYVRGNKLHDSQCPTEWTFTTNLLDRPLRRSNDEILADMFNEDSAWKNCDQDMRDWQEKVARSLATKRQKLNQSGFRLFDKNWLLICDEPGLANDTFTYDRAWRHLIALFSAPREHPRDFDTVFLLSKRYLFSWRPNELSLDYDSRGT